MPEIGLLCSQAGQEEEIEETLQILLIQSGLDAPIHVLFLGKGEKPEDWILGEEWEELSYLILCWDLGERGFELAEILWNRMPSLEIILIAKRAEDIFGALSYPFFHIVRFYSLERDLRAAVRKIKRFRPPAPAMIPFECRASVLRLCRKDILYLDSDRHEIKIHMKDEIVVITESLSQCEEKLKTVGFVRIHKSFLVNMYHISRLEKDSLLLSNQERLYISRYRYPEVKLQFENYIRRLEFM